MFLMVKLLSIFHVTELEMMKNFVDMMQSGSNNVKNQKRHGTKGFGVSLLMKQPNQRQISDPDNENSYTKALPVLW
jgi:hypothetical protein